VWRFENDDDNFLVLSIFGNQIRWLKFRGEKMDPFSHLNYWVGLEMLLYPVGVF
jgi:hypothetical protein